MALTGHIISGYTVGNDGYHYPNDPDLRAVFDQMRAAEAKGETITGSWANYPKKTFKSGAALHEAFNAVLDAKEPEQRQAALATLNEYAAIAEFIGGVDFWRTDIFTLASKAIEAKCFEAFEWLFLNGAGKALDVSYLERLLESLSYGKKQAAVSVESKSAESKSELTPRDRMADLVYRHLCVKGVKKIPHTAFSGGKFEHDPTSDNFRPLGHVAKGGHWQEFAKLFDLYIEPADKAAVATQFLREYYRDPDALQFFFSQGAKVDGEPLYYVKGVPHYSITPLRMCAITSRHRYLQIPAERERELRAMRMLLENNPNVDFAELTTKQTSLMVTIENGDTEKAALLLEFKADPNLKSADGNTALHLAALHWKTDDKKALLEQLFSLPNADLSVRDSKDQAPWHVAISNKNIVAAQAMLAALERRNIPVGPRMKGELETLQRAVEMESQKAKVAPNGFDGSGPFVPAAAPAAENQRPLPAAAAAAVVADAGAAQVAILSS